MNVVLKDIEWKPSRRGLLSPVGVFDPVEINGKSIERVTLFNKEYIKDMELGIGDTISIQFLNGNVPNVKENISKSDSYVIPNRCPVCNRLLVEVGKDLYCVAKTCIGKKAMFITHYCTVMNINGLSYHLIMRLLTKSKFFYNVEDLYKIKNHKAHFRKLLGEEKLNMIMNNIDKSKLNSSLEQFIYALSIVGLPTAKQVSKYCKNDINTFMWLAAKNFDWTESGIFKYKSEEINDEFYKNYKSIKFLSREIYIEPYISPEEYNDKFVGMTFVVTGTPKIFKNRDDVIYHIELYGGNIVGELNQKTTYLVDCGSISGKVKQAKKLGIKIVSEQEFKNMIGE